jgi:peroxiredoxin
MKILPLFALLLCTLTGCSTAAPTAKTAPLPVQPVLTVGAELPFTTVTAIDGQIIALDQPNKRVLLIFFATWCSDSQRAMRQIQASHLVQQSDVQIVGVGREETIKSLQQFASDYQLSFPLVADSDRRLYQQFAQSGVPRLVLVDKNRRIVRSLLAEVPEVLPLIQWREQQDSATVTSR